MASSLHLDPKDTQKLAAAYLGVSINQKDGQVVVSWPANKHSISLRSLQLVGAFTVDKLTVDVHSMEIAESGMDVTFSAK